MPRYRNPMTGEYYEEYGGQVTVSQDQSSPAQTKMPTGSFQGGSNGPWPAQTPQSQIPQGPLPQGTYQNNSFPGSAAGTPPFFPQAPSQTGIMGGLGSTLGNPDFLQALAPLLLSKGKMGGYRAQGALDRQDKMKAEKRQARLDARSQQQQEIENAQRERQLRGQEEDSIFRREEAKRSKENQKRDDARQIIAMLPDPSKAPEWLKIEAGIGDVDLSKAAEPIYIVNRKTGELSEFKAGKPLDPEKFTEPSPYTVANQNQQAILKQIEFDRGQEKEKAKSPLAKGKEFREAYREEFKRDPTPEEVKEYVFGMKTDKPEKAQGLTAETRSIEELARLRQQAFGEDPKTALQAVLRSKEKGDKGVISFETALVQARQIVTTQAYAQPGKNIDPAQIEAEVFRIADEILKRGGAPQNPQQKPAMPTSGATGKWGSGPLTEAEAADYLARAGGDKAKARELAKSEGRTF